MSFLQGRASPRDRGQDRAIAALQAQIDDLRNGGGGGGGGYYEDDYGSRESDSTLTRVMEAAPSFFAFVGLRADKTKIKTAIDQVAAAKAAGGKMSLEVTQILETLTGAVSANIDRQYRAALIELAVKAVMWWETDQSEGGGGDYNDPLILILLVGAAVWLLVREGV